MQQSDHVHQLLQVQTVLLLSHRKEALRTDDKRMSWRWDNVGRKIHKRRMVGKVVVKIKGNGKNDYEICGIPLVGI